VITANSITPFLPVDSTGKNGVMEFSLIINRVPRVQFPCQTRSTPGSCWSWFMIRENSIAPFLPTGWFQKQDNITLSIARCRVQTGTLHFCSPRISSHNSCSWVFY
jgi:hypothetical protein